MCSSAGKWRSTDEAMQTNASTIHSDLDLTSGVAPSVCRTISRHGLGSRHGPPIRSSDCKLSCVKPPSESRLCHILFPKRFRNVC